MFVKSTARGIFYSLLSVSPDDEKVLCLTFEILRQKFKVIAVHAGNILQTIKARV